MTFVAIVRCAALSLLLASAVSAAEPAWVTAEERGPLSADETRALARRLTRFVVDNHLKQTADSPQRGMIYEYFDFAQKGKFDQFVQGEALDTMHDGAWFAAAMVNAHRATGEPLYREVLTRWQLPFYLKMLNHSDTLFSARQNDAGPAAVKFGKEHAFQEGEKGFVPYFWDDGGSVSLERRQKKDPLGFFACTDRLAGKPNPQFLLDGYSLGSSNHLAQDLGLMLQLSWLLFRESQDPAEQKLTAEIVEGARNLHACRMRHFGYIPLSAGPAALATGDAELMKHVPDVNALALARPANDYYRALYDFKPGARHTTAGFADNEQYLYYQGLLKHGAGPMPRSLAFKTVYDAFTGPLAYDYYCDDAPRPAGVNRFDLHGYTYLDGKPADYRSDRKGPSGRPRPIGSRLGPQMMVCTGWALERELGRGLRTWEAILDQYGYLPTGIDAGASWERFSDSGAYAHLTSAASQWIMYLDKKSDWSIHGTPAVSPTK